MIVSCRYTDKSGRLDSGRDRTTWSSYEFRKLRVFFRLPYKLLLSWGFRILYVNEWGLSFSLVTGLSVRVPVCPRCHTSLQLDEPPAVLLFAICNSMMSEYPQPASIWAESVSSAVPTERFEEGCTTFELYRPQHITQHTYVATMLPLIFSSQIFSSLFFKRPSVFLQFPSHSTTQNQTSFSSHNFSQPNIPQNIN